MTRTVSTALFSKSIFEIGLFSMIVNTLLLVMPLFMLQVYDRVLPGASVDTLIYLSIIAILALAFLGLFEIIRSIYSQRAAASIDKRLGSRAFRASLSGPRADAGDIQPLRDLATVRSFIGSRSLMTLFDLPFAPVFLILLGFIHPALFWLTLGGAVIMIVLVMLNQFVNGKNSGAASEQAVRANLAAQAFARNAETLKAMGISGNATEVWGRVFGGSLYLQDRTSAINAVFSGISRSTRMLLQLAILGVGASLVLAGEMTAGMIFATSIISGRALQPLDQLIGGWRQTVEARRAWQRLGKSLPPSADGRQKLQLPDPTGRISVRDLVCVPPGSPPGTEPIIKRLNFEVAAGEAVAIVGPSRAGKSTLARLLVGAISPSSGVVQLDGADLRTWNEAQLGRNIGYLAQDVQLLPGTIAENISRFDLSATDEAIVEAAQAAHAHDLILSQREGYQTQIGSAGIALSGGERQRIGLARAFFAKPKILILDEPNANLDQDGEAALERAIRQARGNSTTVIIITHRMSIAAACDRVLKLRDGAIEKFGRSSDILVPFTGAEPPNAATPAPAPQIQLRSFSTGSQGSGRWGRSLKAEQAGS
ncbi:type I secretion system permease/ATPase [Mesorhizobium sp. BH1-1-5]|uniref:type I secretion system permease/ATPase n=1 Tax=Mesorhizobium sp. BH1-1-5 TaxID=2876661 RepID=UPI001CCE3186|nr:type I secretion system permease/ATPase [Mesorhizobium sp. BH1-1-5]MBZ9991251.1 type I secretion system permease/ATPase [Mesorhizobium sp. BH1-1-5]